MEGGWELGIVRGIGRVCCRVFDSPGRCGKGIFGSVECGVWSLGWSIHERLTKFESFWSEYLF